METSFKWEIEELHFFADVTAWCRYAQNLMHVAVTELTDGIILGKT